MAPAEVEPLWRALGAYLDTLGASFVTSADVAPPVPGLRAVADAGVPVAEAGAFARATAET